MVALCLWIEKNNSIPLVYGESFTKPENFVKICHVNVEVIGLDRNQYKIKKNISRTQALFAFASRKAGGLKIKQQQNM